MPVTGLFKRLTDRRRSRAQSLVEFALVTPILLLIFAGLADFGRAFYAYVAIENAAKEGALYGSRAPLCDDAGAGSCSDPNNVTWRVRNELADQGVRMPDGSEVTPTVTCSPPGGPPHGSLTNCAEADIYEVALIYPFKLLTPVLGDVIGDIDLRTSARAVVLNLAFDPSPGGSINKFVSPAGAVNEADVIAKCLEPDDTDAAGFYRSPCRDSSTADPNDFVTLRFEEGTAISYRIIVTNSGAQTLTDVTVTDSLGGLPGCTFSDTMAVGTTQPVCNYSRIAPVVPGAATAMDFDNTATVTSDQTLPATSGVRVTVEKPPARLVALKFVSPYKLGGTGNGPTFGTNDSLDVTFRPAPQVSSGTVWFKLVVQNTGGQTATGVVITDSHGPIPVTTDCPAVPSSIAAGASWTCLYSVSFSAASPASIDNTIEATATGVDPDSDTATLNVSACTGTDLTVPNVIGLTRDAVAATWGNAGFTVPANWPWNGQPGATALTQSVRAYGCVPATTNMTVTK